MFSNIEKIAIFFTAFLRIAREFQNNETERKTRYFNIKLLRFNITANERFPFFTPNPFKIIFCEA